MKVIIAEKPSVARDLARVLKAASKKEGYFEGTGYQVTWAFGHLIQLANPDAYSPELKKWDINSLPILPTVFKKVVSEDQGVKRQFSIIKNLLLNKSTQEVICATDAGREGELIFRYIYEMAGCTKPVKRLWISSQTDEAILEGFSKLKKGSDYETLYDSAKSRSEADWLIGINATRAYTVRYGRKSGVMSVGRVQTPVLKMIVDRYIEHENFVPQLYYEISALIGHAKGDFRGKWTPEKEERLFDREKAEKIAGDIRRFTQGTIVEVSKKSKNEKPPLLYDLTELQKDANKRFRFSAEKTLNTLQDLYEKHKLVTYPRTSSRYLSTDLKPKMKQLLENARQLPEYAPYAGAILEREPKPDSRVFDNKKVTDHHAIIPTEKKAAGVPLSPDEKKIYDLIIRRFLSIFMGECKKELTEIVTAFGTYPFVTKGTVIKTPGWREVYRSTTGEEDENNEDDQRLPQVKKNDPVTQKELSCEEKKTKAPQLYTEALILAAMETAGRQIEDEELREAMKECGLGTPATRAQILERLIDVNYIIREKNKLIPTDKGKNLIGLITNEELTSPELTGSWEKKLNDIRNGVYSRDTFMEEIRKLTTEIVKNVKFSSGRVQDPGAGLAAQDQVAGIGLCPLCGGAVIERQKVFGCSNWTTTRCGFAIWKTIAQREISEQTARQLLNEPVTDQIDGFMSKKGTTFAARLALKEGRVSFVFDAKAG